MSVSSGRVSLKFFRREVISNNFHLRNTEFSAVHINVLQTEFRSVTLGPQLIDCQKVLVIKNENPRNRTALIKR